MSWSARSPGRFPCRALLLAAAALAPACASGSRAAEERAPEFPRDWLGTWRGEVAVLGGGGPRASFRMELRIAPGPSPERFAWTLTYDGAQGHDVRDYELVVRDAAHGSFALDERDGTVLEARLVGGALYTCFDVPGARLSVREELRRDPGGDALAFELLSSSDQPASLAGASDAARSFPPGTVQRATLRRAD